MAVKMIKPINIRMEKELKIIVGAIEFVYQLLLENY